MGRPRPLKDGRRGHSSVSKDVGNKNAILNSASLVVGESRDWDEGRAVSRALWFGGCSPQPRLNPFPGRHVSERPIGEMVLMRGSHYPTNPRKHPTFLRRPLPLPTADTHFSIRHLF